MLFCNEELGEHNWDEQEFGFVGAGMGGGLKNTVELHVMKYNDPMKTKDADKWQVAVEE